MSEKKNYKWTPADLRAILIIRNRYGFASDSAAIRWAIHQEAQAASQKKSRKKSEQPA